MARREFILNVLLVAIVSLSFVAFVLNFIRWVFGLHDAESTWLILASFILFVFLYVLSRNGFLRLASYGLLIIFFLPVTYHVYKWGIDLPTALLSYAMIIVVAGILINTRMAFLGAFLVSSVIIIIGFFQKIGIISVDRYWIYEIWGVTDLTVVSIFFFIIATVSWLSNREIEKSLTRARKSEADLKVERDSLEITVETRTRELKEMQAEKMTQLYRFAEFGRLSSGLFHDLINPLTAVSLNIEKVKNAGETKRYVDKAIIAARKMEDMVSAVRKQLSRQETKTLFSVNEEIAQAIDVLSHKAMKAGVKMRFQNGNEIKTYGDSVKFNQVALNLLTNAIDAGGKTVEIFLTSKKDEITLSVKDDGTSIKEENISKIFEPFFTTKAEGIGIGLSMTKRIIEKDFGGTIEVKSQTGRGSVFTIKFPKRNSI